MLKPRADFYADKHPEPRDILLVVEVAETSQEYDRQIKLPLYAQAGVPEVWLVDLKSEIVESYHRPVAHSYEQVRKYQRGERLASHSVSALKLSIDEILS